MCSLTAPGLPNWLAGPGAICSSEMLVPLYQTAWPSHSIRQQSSVWHILLILASFLSLTCNFAILEGMYIALSVFTLQWIAVGTYFGRVLAAASGHHEVVPRRIVADGTGRGISSLASFQHHNWHSSCKGKFITFWNIRSILMEEFYVTEWPKINCNVMIVCDCGFNVNLLCNGSALTLYVLLCLSWFRHDNTDTLRLV
jgi:hypothetical protein